MFSLENINKSANKAWGGGGRGNRGLCNSSCEGRSNPAEILKIRGLSHFHLFKNVFYYVAGACTRYQNAWKPFTIRNDTDTLPFWREENYLETMSLDRQGGGGGAGTQLWIGCKVQAGRRHRGVRRQTALFHHHGKAEGTILAFLTLITGLQGLSAALHFLHVICVTRAWSLPASDDQHNQTTTVWTFPVLSFAAFAPTVPKCCRKLREHGNISNGIQTLFVKEPFVED